MTEDVHQGFRLRILVTRITPPKRRFFYRKQVVGVGVVRVKIYATKCDRENPG